MHASVQLLGQHSLRSSSCSCRWRGRSVGVHEKVQGLRACGPHCWAVSKHAPSSPKCCCFRSLLASNKDTAGSFPAPPTDLRSQPRVPASPSLARARDSWCCREPLSAMTRLASSKLCARMYSAVAALWSPDASYSCAAACTRRLWNVLIHPGRGRRSLPGSLMAGSCADRPAAACCSCHPAAVAGACRYRSCPSQPQPLLAARWGDPWKLACRWPPCSSSSAHSLQMAGSPSCRQASTPPCTSPSLTRSLHTRALLTTGLLVSP